MKKSTTLFEVGSLLAITILLAYDFFPALRNVIYIPKTLILLIITAIIISNLLINRKNEQSEKKLLVRQIVTTAYLMLIIIVFTAIGGASQVGISLDSPALWIVVALSVFQIIRQRNKYTQSRGGVE